jgi:CubicO group peptidase (beta-lactamase class C family)
MNDRGGNNERNMTRLMTRRNFFREAGGGALFALGISHQNISESEQSLIADLTASIPDLMSRHKVPGLSIALIRDGKLNWSKGFGYANVEKKTPVTPATVFEAASLSKPVFAYAVLRLCDSGKMAVDRPLSDYLSKPFIDNEPRLKSITAEMVLSHSSGLPHGRPPGTPISLRFTPGEKFAYSATGFQYLQLVVEEITKQSLADFMKTGVLNPLGMSNSSFGWIERFNGAAAQGYDGDGDAGLSGNGEYLEATPEELEKLKKDYPEYKYPSASAGLYTTAEDYAKFMIEMLQPQRIPLSASLMERMFKQRVKINDSISWGLGWGLESVKSNAAFWHWGDWGVFRNFTMADRKRKIGVVILTNSFNGPRVYREIVPKAIDGEHPSLPWVARYRP